MSGPVIGGRTVRIRCLRAFWLHGRAVQAGEEVDVPHLAALEVLNAKRGEMLDPEAMADIRYTVDVENQRHAAAGRNRRSSALN